MPENRYSSWHIVGVLDDNYSRTKMLHDQPIMMRTRHEIRTDGKDTQLMAKIHIGISYIRLLKLNMQRTKHNYDLIVSKGHHQ